MNPTRLIHRQLAKKGMSALLITSVAGCSVGDYPTAKQVSDASANVPSIESINDGLGYLAVVRDDFVQKRQYLQALDGGMDAGIVGGLVALTLGTALKWGAHVNVITGTTSAAIIGVSSALNLKQQELIINRGLDALNCVQAQAEAAYLAVRPYDNALLQVRLDVKNLETAIKTLGPQAAQADLVAAQADLANAKIWLSVESVAAENVGAAVKIAVDTTLQTTVDQLNQVLPDGSAFAKISLTPPSSGASPPTNNPPPQSNALRTPPPPGENQPRPDGLVQTADQAKAQSDAHAAFSTLSAAIIRDETAAQEKITALGPVPSPTQLPSFSCSVTSLPQPLKVSFVKATIALAQGSSLVATITGGIAPYSASVTADMSVTPPPTPQNIGVPGTVTGTTVTLTNSALITSGTYTLVIQDSAGSKATAPFTAQAAGAAELLLHHRDKALKPAHPKVAPGQ